MEKARFYFWIGIAISVGIWASIAYTAPLFGFNLASAFAIASSIAVGIFGGFAGHAIKVALTKPKPKEEAPEVKRCLIITAPSHGVLQDRANNWLSGNYGKVESLSLSFTDKGAFMAIYYAAPDPKRLEVKEDDQ